MDHESMVRISNLIATLSSIGSITVIILLILLIRLYKPTGLNGKSVKFTMYFCALASGNIGSAIVFECFRYYMNLPRPAHEIARTSLVPAIYGNMGICIIISAIVFPIHRLISGIMAKKNSNKAEKLIANE